jgi:uncharacterized protein (TIGR03435 family)
MKRREITVGETLDRALGFFRKASPELMESVLARVAERLKDEHLDAFQFYAPNTETVRPVRSLRRFVAAAALAVIAIVIPATMIQRPPARVDAPLAVVAGSHREIKKGESVRAGYPQGLVLQAADGSRIEMRALSELRLERANDGIRVRLDSGTVIVTAAEQRNGHLYVQTKDVTVSVIGTVFLVNTEETGSRVTVLQGEVQVQQGTVSRKLVPGQQVATNPTMQSVPLLEEIQWSINAASHVALLQQSVPITLPTASPERQEFEAATIRPMPPVSNDGPMPGGGVPACQGIDGRFGSNGTGTVPQGRCVGVHVSLVGLIAAAYEMGEGELTRIVGLPGWAHDPYGNAFNIEAKAENTATATKAQLRQMLQSLLADRFKLKVSWRPGQIDGYILSVANNGPKLKEAAIEEAFTENNLTHEGGRDRIITGKASIRAFTEFLSHRIWLLAPVVDNTNLKGTYVLNLSYSLPLWRPIDVGQRGGVGSVAEQGFSAFQAAMQEQLGLRLERAKVPHEFMVIDHIEKPSEN